MSHAGHGPPMENGFEFWDFIACAICFLPYASENTLTVPFWLTECGHIVCNNHLKSDRSCAECHATEIQLAPLQKEMDEPMSSWFTALPTAMDNIAHAAKFQQETMAKQIRHFHSKYMQYKGFAERLKRELTEMKKENQSLIHENEQLRSSESTADYTNANGKRPKLLPPSNQYFQGGSSSPRSIPTPIAPHRLTLPRTQQVPELSSTRQSDQYATEGALQARPATNRRSIQNYAYAPPKTPQFRVPPLSRAQAAPLQFKRPPTRGNNSDPGPSEPYHFVRSANQDTQQQHRPEISRFKPPETGNSKHSSTAVRPRPTGNMGPPPTPKMGDGGGAMSSQASKRLAPSTQSHPQQQQKRFFPLPSVTPHRNVSNQNQNASTTSYPSRSSTQQLGQHARTIGTSGGGMLNVGAAGTGGQRMPFLPGGNKPSTSQRLQSSAKFQ